MLVRRVDLKRLAEVRDGLFFVAFLLVCDAPVGVGGGIFGVERDGLVVVRDSVIILALVEASPAMIKVGADRFLRSLRHPISLDRICHELDGRHLLAGCSRPFRPPTLLSRTG